jgi:hypothetical protein
VSRLYLRCVLCGRQTAEERPALRGAKLRACPTCIQRHPDWQERMLVVLGVAGASDDFRAAR